MRPASTHPIPPCASYKDRCAYVLSVLRDFGGDIERTARAVDLYPSTVRAMAEHDRWVWSRASTPAARRAA